MTKLFVVGALVLSGIFSSSAMAANVLSAKEKISVKGSPAEIWAKVGGYCAIKDWHPVVEKCEVAEVDGATVRTLTLKDGAVLKEKQTGKTETNYTYTITDGPLPVEKYNAIFSVRPDFNAEGNTVISWSGTFGAHGKPDKEVKELIQGVYKAGMDGIKEKLATK